MIEKNRKPYYFTNSPGCMKYTCILCTAFIVMLWGAVPAEAQIVDEEESNVRNKNRQGKLGFYLSATGIDRYMSQNSCLGEDVIYFHYPISYLSARFKPYQFQLSWSWDNNSCNSRVGTFINLTGQYNYSLSSFKRNNGSMFNFYSFAGLKIVFWSDRTGSDILHKGESPGLVGGLGIEYDLGKLIWSLEAGGFVARCTYKDYRCRMVDLAMGFHLSL